MTSTTITARALRTGLAAALAGAAWLAHAPTAEAGTYVVYGCKTQTAGEAGGIDLWSMTQRYSGNTYRNCVAGSASDPIEIDFDATRTHPADDEMNLTFTPPADTDIQDYKIWRTVRLGTVYNSRLLELKKGGGYAEVDRCYPTEGCRERGVFPPWNDSSNEISGWNRTDLRGLQIKITCGNGSNPCPDQAPAAQYLMHRSDIRLVDNFVPTVTGVSGGLAAGAPVTGVQTLSFSATDRGGGIHQAWLAVDGVNQGRVTVDPNGGKCSGRPWRAARPCNLAVSGSLSLDTSRLADGEHQLMLMVSDVTGTNVGRYGPIKLVAGKQAGRPAPLSPGATANCNPGPGAGTLVMHAGIGHGSRRSVTTGVRAKPLIHGRLRTPEGAPVAGAAVCVLIREQLAGATTTDGGNLTTDGAGRFAYRLPRGVSRSVTFVHRVPSGAVTANVVAAVRAPVKLRASRRHLRNGQSVQFKGALRARARRGLLVELQARVGNGWQTFKTTRTRANGKFTARYRFTRTRGSHRYRLRARMPQQRSLPFAAGASRPVVVTVRG